MTHLEDIFKYFYKINKRTKRLFRSILKVSLLFAVITPVSALGSFDNFTIGPRYLGLAGSGVARTSQPSGVYINPAAIWSPSGYSMHVIYARRFGLAQLADKGAVFTGSFNRYKVGLAYHGFGFEQYQERTCHLAIAAPVALHMIAGMAIRYADLFIQNYGSDGAVIVDAGILIKLTEQAYFGFSVKNINNAQIGRIREELPRILQLGALCRPNSNITLLLDLYKDVHFPLDIRCGISYEILHALTLRLGTATDPSRAAGGFGVQKRSMFFDYAFQFHPELGLTHQVSMGFIMP